MAWAVNSDEFIREVDEAVRQDRWLQLAKEYGVYLIAGALAIVLGTAAGVGWRTWQHNQRLDEARRYAAAEELLRQDKPDEAGKAFLALAKDADSGYGIIARLRAAEAQAKAGEAKGARAGAERPCQGCAGGAGIPAARRSSGGPAGFRHRRSGDADRPAGGPDRARQLPGATARSSSRRWPQLRAGQTDAARRTLGDLLQDAGTPPDLSRRAAELLASLGGPLEAAPKAAAKDATAADAPAQDKPTEEPAQAVTDGARRPCFWRSCCSRPARAAIPGSAARTSRRCRASGSR